MGYTNYEAMPLDQMLARIQKYHPGDSYKLVEKAYHFAEKAHAGQTRKSGEPYFIHPCFVASILTELMIDAPTIAAGLAARHGGGLRGHHAGDYSAGVWRRRSPGWWTA